MELKTRTRRKLTALGTSATAIGLIFSGMMTGTAEAAKTDCPSNRFCLWQHSDYSGRGVVFSGAVADFRTIDFNDRASSVYNRTNIPWCLYEGINYQGRLPITPQGSSRDLANLLFNDMASSIRPAPC